MRKKITINLNGWKDPLGIIIDGISSINDYDPQVNPYLKFFGEEEGVSGKNIKCIL